MTKDYTHSQLEVINVNSGYNMVLAGPGCGKTDILAERIARAYESGSVSLENVLCLTFTNRAARGMFDRISKRLGPDAEDLFVGNIQRYRSHFLFGSGIGSAETSVMDEADTEEILDSEISDSDIKKMIGYSIENCGAYYLVSVDWYTVNDILGITIYPSKPGGRIKEEKANMIIKAAKMKILALHHLMDQVLRDHPKEDFLYPDILHSKGMKSKFPFANDFKQACMRADYDEATFASLKPEYKFLALATKISKYKKDNCLLDFDDLLIQTYDAYRSDTNHEYRRFSWVQVDEIQDLSHFQISLVDMFSDTENDFVVLYLGDEQQAIYSFMGASLSTLDMLKSRCGTRIFRLDKNFRSPKYLLDIYNEYAVEELGVDKDFLPAPKDELEAGRYDLCLHIYDTLDNETLRIKDSILPFLRKDTTSADRTAILVPWNKDADEVSYRLKESDIPHFKISGADSFQTTHMRTLMAHFNAVSNDFNLIAWSRILKQAHAVDTYSEGRHLVSRMRDLALCPSDLLREDDSSYLGDFCNAFDNEEIVLYDTETTGVDIFNEDIVQIAAVKIKAGEIVPGSEFNIFLHTDKIIPEKLGKLDNPMVKEYAAATKYSRSEGLRLFMDYVGNCTLMGHNVQFDYNILKQNLRRDCPLEFDSYRSIVLDTLHIAHLLYPRLRRYKLAFLLERLSLDGENSHMADADIMATYSLAKYSRGQAEDFLSKQKDFLTTQVIHDVKDKLFMNYRDCYLHTKNLMYELCDSGCALVEEMDFVDKYLEKVCRYVKVDRFDLILEFLRADVISSEESNSIFTHLSNHLMDLSTYREADLCGSSSFKENLFVSTVHKAKGLEFENVIVLRSVDGRYPHFAHKEPQQKEEDKRLFYVAISRAMKRLVVSGADNQVMAFTPFMKPIMHHFLLRVQLPTSQYSKILAEISSHSLVLKIEDHQKNRYIMEYGPLDDYYIKNGFDQKDLADTLESLCHGINDLDEIDKYMQDNNVSRVR
ncbi:MAG: UvrD-helicase domain-containing protein [Bacteroidales bacterium]|nr:UvrD-helicase domain-containing protein [Bacteroidales bacterium]